MLFTLYAASSFYFMNSPSARIPILVWMLISFSLAFLTGGFSETFTPAFLVLLAGVTVLSLFLTKFNLKERSTLFLLAGFFGAFIALFVMVFAPGNSVRQAYFPAPPDLLTVLRVTFTSYFAFLWSILSSPYILSGLLGTGISAVWLGMRMNRIAAVQAPAGWWAPLLLLVGLILAFGCFPPAVYGTSEPPPTRTLIIPAFLLTICFLASNFTLGEWLSGRVSQVMIPSAALLLIAWALILFSCYEPFQKLSSMRADHAAFAQQWDQVDRKIRDARSSGLEQVSIPSLTNWADAPYPTDNPKYWPNICYSKFYDINITAPPLQP
jgi:hypothetical protein